MVLMMVMMGMVVVLMVIYSGVNNGDDFGVCVYGGEVD